MGKWMRGGHCCRDRIRVLGLVAGRGLWGKGWGWGGGGCVEVEEGRVLWGRG